MEYGFVYIWYDRKHKRYYIGCHWGTIDDGYICSSHWMQQAYGRRPQDFSRKILSYVYTCREDMFEEEMYWHSLIKDHELKTKYYNIVRAKKHWSSDTAVRQTIVQKISKANTGNPKLRFPRPKTDEHKKKLSDANKGKPLSHERSESTRAKISDNSRRLQSEGLIGMSGKLHSEETKEKMSKNNAMQDPCKRAKIGDANRGKVALWINNKKKMAKPGTDLYLDLLSQGYMPKMEIY